MPACEAAGDQHQRDGKGDADVAYEVVGSKQPRVPQPRGEVRHQEPNHIQYRHGADIVYPAPSAGEEHDEGRGAEEVYQVGKDGLGGVILL